jgi:hypothetical protein
MSVFKNIGLMGDNLRPGTSVQSAITTQRMNAIMDTVRGLARGDNIRPGVGFRKVATADGFILVPYGTRSTNNSRWPFDITVTANKAYFRAGTINGFLPTNYSTGTGVNSSGTEYLVLNCTSSNGKITAASFGAQALQPGAITPTKGLPPTSFALLIGVLVNGQPTKIWGDGNINASVVESFRADRDPITPGQLPYDIYYTWQFTLV